MERKTNRGGARVGSGRKPAPQKKHTISFRVSQEIKDKLQELRDAGYNVNQAFEQIIRDASV